MNRSVDYRKRGQAVWLDSISARMIATGELAGRIEAGAVYGVTSNPTIFAQAIARATATTRTGSRTSPTRGRTPSRSTTT